MGCKSQGAIGNLVKIGGKDIRINTLIRMCNMLDYDVVLKPHSNDVEADKTIILSLNEDDCVQFITMI